MRIKNGSKSWKWISVSLGIPMFLFVLMMTAALLRGQVPETTPPVEPPPTVDLATYQAILLRKQILQAQANYLDAEERLLKITACAEKRITPTECGQIDPRTGSVSINKPKESKEGKK